MVIASTQPAAHHADESSFFSEEPAEHTLNSKCATEVRGYDNHIISTIVRFHNPQRLPFLEEAVFSLAIQQWPEVETIVVLQNGNDELKKQITEIINHQPWIAPPKYQIISVNIPAGIDGRSTLLNQGMKHATGRFLAFLDDDDVIYQHGYATLIQQLLDGGRAVAVGGSRNAKVEYVSHHWYVKEKERAFTWGRTQADLFWNNFVLIHSYVIDRSRLGDFHLYFDDELPPSEDYDFLLRLCAAFDFDFSKLSIPVCEYRIHTSNSIPYRYIEGADNSPEAIAAYERYQRAGNIINERKKNLVCSMPVRELIELKDTVAALQYQNESLAREYEEVLHVIARKAHFIIRQHPWLHKRLGHIIHRGWQAYRKLKYHRSEDGRASSSNS